MFDKLDAVVERFDELEAALATTEIACDPARSMPMMRERAGMEETVLRYREWRRVLADLESAELLMRDESDPEMRALAREEMVDLARRRDELETRLRELMVPRDPRDDRNVVLEVRAGTGGEEAALFAGDLLRMYLRYAELRRWQVEELSSSEASQGGVKEIAVLIRGHGAYSRLKYESGAHRVQRVPATESQGRIHTSACTVAVLPEAEEVDVAINPTDLRIDTYRASGAGGQHVNRTDSAVRITHLPTGVVVQCQDERSQHKNRDRAMLLLRTKLYNAESERLHQETAADRKAQVGSGDRSERIRTYNFPQNRLTDHRINLTLYALDQIVTGDLDPVIEPLMAAERAARLAEAGVG